MSHFPAEDKAFAVNRESMGVTASVVALVFVLPTLALDPQVAGQVGLELRPVRHRAVPQSLVWVELRQLCKLRQVWLVNWQATVTVSNFALVCNFILLSLVK